MKAEEKNGMREEERRRKGTATQTQTRKGGSHSLHVDEAILLQPINIQGGYNCGQRTEKANRTKKREKKCMINSHNQRIL